MGLAYFSLINVFTFGIFGLDKARARVRGWRVPESALLFLAFLGGALGGFLGMKVFRHKTRKLKFRLGLPLLFLFNLGVIMYFIE